MPFFSDSSVGHTKGNAHVERVEIAVGEAFQLDWHDEVLAVNTIGNGRLVLTILRRGS